MEYLVIFSNENYHKFHYTRNAATYIQFVGPWVAEFTCKQVREGCRVSNNFQSRTEYDFWWGENPKSKRQIFVPSRKKM